MNHIENSFSSKQNLSNEKQESIVQMARDGAWDSVLVEVENLLIYFPDSPFLHGMKGDAHFQSNNLDDAKDSYKEVIKLDPNRAIVFFNLGVIEEENGNLNRALEYFQQGIKSKKDFCICHYRLGCLLHYKGNIKKALNSYINALKSNPDCVQSYARKD